MTSLILAILVAAWLGSFCATVLFLVGMTRREPPPYVEGDDGVQPPDPYLLVPYQGLFITGDYKWTAMQ